MGTLIRKLSSRKLWAAIVGVIAGLSIVFGLDENVIGTASGAVMAVASLITYIVTEGKIDAAAVKETVTIVQDVVESIDETE